LSAGNRLRLSALSPGLPFLVCDAEWSLRVAHSCDQNPHTQPPTCNQTVDVPTQSPHSQY